MTRILVVEDSPTQAEVLRLALEAQGWAAEVAYGGRAGLERARAGGFDLVLSDVLMPDQSGYELCRALKADPQTAHTPVVLVTQLSDPLDVLRGLECGADNFLTKPLDAAYLAQRLRAVLDSSARRAAGEPQTGTLLSFRGRGLTVTADKAQILDLLLAAVEESVRAREREARAWAAEQAQERRAADLAEAARRKDEFLAALSHELRAPLVPLLNALHVARRPQAGPLREQALETADRQARHLARLVEDMLDASRLARGQAQLRRERVDLARLAREAAEDRRGVLEGAGLALAVDTSETPVWVRGDPVRLTQVLGNLLDNAQKFAGRGARVEVVLAVDAGGRRAALAVRDDGAGVAPELLPRLFTPLTPAAQGMERQGGGLGLGLAMVKALAELHGGSVTAASAGLGRGAEFVVRLPVEGEPPALSAPEELQNRLSEDDRQE